MTEDTVKLVKCACGGSAYREQPVDKAPFYVRCYKCSAMTPAFTTQALADAAWTRMMTTEATEPQFQQAMEKVLTENTG